VRVGPGMEPDVQLGPMINEAAVEKIDRLVGDAVGRGARVRCGGERLTGPGYFYPPTVLDQVPAGSELLADEIFGPVAPIVTFEDESDAIAAANDNEYRAVPRRHRPRQRYRVRARRLRLLARPPARDGGRRGDRDRDGRVEPRRRVRPGG